MKNIRLVHSASWCWSTLLAGIDIDYTQMYTGEVGLMRVIEVGVHLGFLRLAFGVEWLLRPYSAPGSWLNDVMAYDAEAAERRRASWWGQLQTKWNCWRGRHVEPLEYCGLAFPLEMYRCTACNRAVKFVEAGTELVYVSRDQFLTERYGG